MTGNLLGQETSPYLLQHADNPVHWMPWGADAFQRAQRDNKPILLSVGYAACHWCHVMAHESFEDPSIAAVMNELFVNVKVDREERPDVDQIYQAALAMLEQPGGWPLTMFLTPDGKPFWGGTYFPPTERWGRPGFVDVLRGVAHSFQSAPKDIEQNTAALTQGLGQLAKSQPGGRIPTGVIDRVAKRLVREVDPFFGGIGDAPKFPHVPAFDLFWRAWLRTGLDPFRRAVRDTLYQMCHGGIYDHLGGGFARYSTDDAWLVPHFEKMLYDNAQLVSLLTLVSRTFDGQGLYPVRVAETIDWLLREMVAAPNENGDAAFASTLDADSEGEEGRFYVWTEAEIDAVLGPDAGAFKRAYDVTPRGNWEGRTILNRSGWLIGDVLDDAEAEAGLRAMRQKLLAARERRVRPGWDDKVLADWNGLMIAAMADAAVVFHRPDWLAAAASAFRFVRDTMTMRRGPEAGRLRHSWRQGQLKHPGMLDDHAAMAKAAVALFEATGDFSYVAAAEGWIAELDNHFWDAMEGGYFLTADDAETLIVRTKNAMDQAVPSGNGMMVEVLAKLHLVTGKPAYRDRAEAIVTAFTGSLARNALGFATLLNGAETLEQAEQVVVIGPSDGKDTAALIDIVTRAAPPSATVIRLAPETDLPDGHPAAGKTMIDGRATAYVCRGPVCSLPVTAPKALLAELAGCPT